MATYHLSAKIISRGSGRSSVGAAAYRSGERLTNERDGLTHDYTHKQGVAHKEILAPDHAPEWARDREQLWNAVEKVENRKDAQTAREIEVALPKELSRENQIELVREYTKENFVDKGMIADVAIHDKGDGNPHAHIMLTTRPINEKGFEGKERDWNKRGLLENWRKEWSNHANRSLEREGIDQRIDHRSYQDQGIEKLPQIHLGAAHQMEKRGIETELGNKNREIEEKNKDLELINRQEKAYSKQKEIYQERELEERKNPETQNKTDQNQEKERQPELTKNKAEEFPQREREIEPKREEKKPLTHEEWQKIKQEQEIKKQEREARNQEIYERRIEKSYGDQRTWEEKREGVRDEGNMRFRATIISKHLIRPEFTLLPPFLPPSLPPSLA